ncbi:MAG: peptide-methionine (R)-S-oxide reductase MsrB [Hyphomonadaceae bacterium]
MSRISRRALFFGASAAAMAGCSADAQQGRYPGSAPERRYANSPFRTLTPAQWRERLSPEAFRVLRREGTERAGTSPLDRERRRGTYVCAGCALPLFRSQDKYNSGTGWPSFRRGIPGALGTYDDNSLFGRRIAYRCAQCLGHQGHVFEDGPPPTGQRWCNNGVALRFVPA